MSRFGSDRSSLVAAILVILYLAFQGSWFVYACDVNNMVIGTVRSGKEIGGQTEWTVTLTNRCSCSIDNIILSCEGFRSAEPINQSVLKVDGGRCLLYGGMQLRAGGSLTFSYAWNSPFILTPLAIHPVGC